MVFEPPVEKRYITSFQLRITAPVYRSFTQERPTLSKVTCLALREIARLSIFNVTIVGTRQSITVAMAVSSQRQRGTARSVRTESRGGSCVRWSSQWPAQF